MKPQTYIGIVILGLFVLFTVVAFPIAKEVIYMFGCFAFGWNIPRMSELVYQLFRKNKTA